MAAFGRPLHGHRGGGELRVRPRGKRLRRHDERGCLSVARRIPGDRSSQPRELPTPPASGSTAEPRRWSPARSSWRHRWRLRQSPVWDRLPPAACALLVTLMWMPGQSNGSGHGSPCHSVSVPEPNVAVRPSGEIHVARGRVVGIRPTRGVGGRRVLRTDTDHRVPGRSEGDRLVGALHLRNWGCRLGV